MSKRRESALDFLQRTAVENALYDVCVEHLDETSQCCFGLLIPEDEVPKGVSRSKLLQIAEGFLQRAGGLNTDIFNEKSIVEENGVLDIRFYCSNEFSGTLEIVKDKIIEAFNQQYDLHNRN